jgi:lauroyl/myristoyl acyltransferase
MADSLRGLRHRTTQLAVGQAIGATRGLPVGLQRSCVRSMIAFAGGIPMLRRRVRENMRLALGREVPDGAERRYFRHLGWYLSNALPVFNRGLMAARVAEQVKFDESIHVLDEAVAEGRGVVFIFAHWSGHELMAAIVNRRHPMTLLVRQAPTSERMARKLKWYGALGAEIVLRPNRTSTIHHAAAYLKVLKRGRLLGITPDLLAGPGEGVETRIFGRPARLHGGAFAIAIATRAPMIRFSCRWQGDSSATITFERATTPVAGGGDSAIRAAVQDWCGWFEGKLRANPETWQFWLDKRWSRFLRATPPA